MQPSSPSQSFLCSQDYIKESVREREVEDKEEEEMRSTQHISGKSCCAVVTAQVDLCLSCFKYEAADLT